MSVKQTYYRLYAKKLIAEFEKRNMEGFYFASAEEALRGILEMFPENAVVSCGGSQTLHEIGLIERLKSGAYSFLDPHATQTPADREKIAHEALACEYYFMGCNAIAETGELVNIDGIGNRVAALIFGPRNVIVVAGMNKVVPDLESAARRTKTQAAQMAVLQFQSAMVSYETIANAAKDAESQLVITSRTDYKHRIKVVLIGENLGY